MHRSIASDYAFHLFAFADPVKLWTSLRLELQRGWERAKVGITAALLADMMGPAIHVNLQGLAPVDSEKCTLKREQYHAIST